MTVDTLPPASTSQVFRQKMTTARRVAEADGVGLGRFERGLPTRVRRVVRVAAQLLQAGTARPAKLVADPATVPSRPEALPVAAGLATRASLVDTVARR